MGSLHFLLSAMHALKRKTPLAESFLAQLDVDLMGAGIPMDYESSLESLKSKGFVSTRLFNNHTAVATPSFSSEIMCRASQRSALSSSVAETLIPFSILTNNDSPTCTKSKPKEEHRDLSPAAFRGT